MDNRTEQLADGVWRVEAVTYVNAFVLANDGVSDAEGLTVVDTGTPKAGPKLVRSIRMLGLDPRAVGDVLLTHWHRDHAGSAARFAASSAGTRVWVGAGDLGVVRGERRQENPGPPDSTRLGQLFRRVIGGYQTPEAVPSAQGVAGGEVREVAGGLEVIATPGHTPGHVAYLLPSRGVLIAGDALWNVGFLSRGPRFLCTALSAQRDTAARIADLDYGTLAVAHGPQVTDRPRERVARLAAH